LGAELRWILLILSLPLLAGIWWWTARRAAQAPGNAELRESVPPLEPRYSEPLDDMRPEPRDWGVPPFEPLNIRTAEFDHVPVLDGPMMVHTDPTPSAAPATVPVLPAMTATTIADGGDRRAGAEPRARDAEPPVPDAAERQRIVTIRICAVGDARWSGERLMAALELHGLAFGNYQVFHRRHTDGRSLFCVASLIEPGTFDIDEMAHQEFRGVTLFAILPGPATPLATMDELFGTARGLAEELSGMVQDSKGMPLSPQRAAALREDIARFQASLSGN
jgi:cell division protein ZipA